MGSCHRLAGTGTPAKGMEMQESIYGMVDFAFLHGAWPQSNPEQTALLTGIHAQDWHRSTWYGIDNYLFGTRRYRCIAKTTVDTRFGQRWFHVWRSPVGSKLVAVKQPAPDTPVMVCCELSASPGSIDAAFSLLSGRFLGTAAFNAISAEEPLLVNDLRTAASEQALSHGLLETHRQAAGLVISGFQQDLPDGLLLWCSNAVTESELQAWLAYLQSLPPAELASFDCIGSDVSPMSEATSGLESCSWEELETASDESDVESSTTEEGR